MECVVLPCAEGGATADAFAKASAKAFAAGGAQARAFAKAYAAAIAQYGCDQIKPLLASEFLVCLLVLAFAIAVSWLLARGYVIPACYAIKMTNSLGWAPA